MVARFNADPAVSAFLVQLPLPEGLDEERVLLAVDPDKDVDGLHPVNLGRLVMGAPGPSRAPRPASSSCSTPTTCRSRAVTWSSSAGASPSAVRWPCSWP